MHSATPPLGQTTNTHADTVQEQAEKVEEHHREAVVAELRDDARADDGHRREHEPAERRRAEAVLGIPDTAAPFAPSCDYPV